MSSYTATTTSTRVRLSPGQISDLAIARARKLCPTLDIDTVQVALGRAVTATKEWLTPEGAPPEVLVKIAARPIGLQLHGMTRLAYDRSVIYLNGENYSLHASITPLIGNLCRHRRLDRDTVRTCLTDPQRLEWLGWMLAHGAFEVPARP